MNWKDKLREMYFVDSSIHREHEAFVQQLLDEQQEEFSKTLNSGRKMYELGRKEALEEVLKLQQELNVDGNLFDVISPDNVKQLLIQ